LQWGYIANEMAATQSLTATRQRITFCGHVHEPALYHSRIEGGAAVRAAARSGRSADRQPALTGPARFLRTTARRQSRRVLRLVRLRATDADDVSGSLRLSMHCGHKYRRWQPPRHTPDRSARLGALARARRTQRPCARLARIRDRQRRRLSDHGRPRCDRRAPDPRRRLRTRGRGSALQCDGGASGSDGIMNDSWVKKRAARRRPVAANMIGPIGLIRTPART
jgi:hypothetical protein